jgi:DNA-binding MarR family transcriptional regulator
MKKDQHKSLDPVIHQPVRLQIMTFLHLAKEAKFAELKNELNITDGNLGSHLVKLEEKKYIKTNKKFIGSKPTTLVSITVTGEKRLVEYLDVLKSLINV